MSERRSLLFLLNALGVGGSESKIVRVANALRQHDECVEVAYLNPPETLLGRLDPAVRVTHLQRRGKYSLRSLALLRGRIRKARRTVVAVNLYPLLYAVPAVKWMSATGCRVVGLVNTSAKERLPGRIDALYTPLLRQCDQLVFGCESELALWTGMHELPVERSEYIYNGVDASRFSPAVCRQGGDRLRQELGITSDTFVFGSVGRLAPEKHFDLLVHALAEFESRGRLAVVMIAGEGPEGQALTQLAREKGVSERLHLLGLQPDVRPVLGALDAFVLPSRSVETFSNAALEAMSSSLPVVLSDIGGAAEMLEHGRSGLIFPVGDLGALNRLLGSLDESQEARIQLGVAARQRVLERFQFGDMVERYRRLASD